MLRVRACLFVDRRRGILGHLAGSRRLESRGLQSRIRISSRRLLPRGLDGIELERPVFGRLLLIERRSRRDFDLVLAGERRDRHTSGIRIAGGRDAEQRAHVPRLSEVSREETQLPFPQRVRRQDVAVPRDRVEGNHLEANLRLRSQGAFGALRRGPRSGASEPGEHAGAEAVAGTISRRERHSFALAEEHHQHRNPGPLALGARHQLGVDGAQHGDRPAKLWIAGVTVARERQRQLLLHPDGRIDHVDEAHRATPHKRETPLGVEVRERSLPIGAPHKALNEDLRRDCRLHRAAQ